MIKLFRNIRQKLLHSGKLKSYMAYAIGEIVLVVIGILIALQINNWNEERKNKRLEYQMLQDLKSDLEETLVDFNDDIFGNQLFLNSTRDIQNHIFKNLPFHDSLVMKFTLMTFQTTLFEKSTAYESLKSSGLNIISNNEVKKQITDFYNLDIVRAKRISAPNFDVLFKPYLEENFDVNLDSTLLKYWPESVIKRKGSLANGNLGGFVPLNYSHLKSDPKFRVLLRNAINIRLEIISIYTNYSNFLNQLIKLIEEEIETKK